jgi:uncharacterized protein
MNLLSLGAAGHDIFAIHDPAVASSRARAAVLCNPGGSEQVFAHRSLRHLALRLARLGIHVVRFDYFGTGDSGGYEEGRPEGLQKDLLIAIEAAMDISGAAQVTLIGLRLGADVAARLACTQPSLVESVVLWDPLDPQPAEIPAQVRSLKLLTDEVAATDTMAAPRCWEESVTTTGALPVAVFQRIEAWLR